MKHNAVRLQGFLTHPPVTSVIGKGVINGQLQQLTMQPCRAKFIKFIILKDTVCKAFTTRCQ